MRKKIKSVFQREVTVEGMMTFGKTDDGLVTADFQCCEDVQMETFMAKCQVQCMRDGNIYVTELPKRLKNKALFREDNSSLSLGRNGKFYFVFTLDADEVNELPSKLVHQASQIAQKVVRELVINSASV